jgi:hypothetical protein
MNEQYRVVLVIPPGYIHARCFAETAFLLKNSLVDVGKDCDIAINDFAKNRTNIVLGYHLLGTPDIPGLFRYIPYQLEQLSASENLFSDKIRSLLEGAAEIWDYSQENIEFLANQGISARHLPVGYHPSLEMISKGVLKDIDILFFGSMADRRKNVLDTLSESGANVKTLFGVYGKDRDALIARARIVINIHYYSSKIFEAIRTSYLFNNACCVVSESSEQYPYPNVAAALVDYDSLASKCMEILATPGATNMLGQQNYEEFRTHYIMKDMVRPLVS